MNCSYTATQTILERNDHLSIVLSQIFHVYPDVKVRTLISSEIHRRNSTNMIYNCAIHFETLNIRLPPNLCAEVATLRLEKKLYHL